MAKPPKQKAGTQVEVPTTHWADHAAEELIQLHPGKTQFVCASGISPSGIVHIGNFREVITVDFVVRALRDRGKKVRFLYSWDDYDALRKVPANLPNPTLIQENLRRPLAKVPDPFGDCPSYSAHFEGLFEKEIEQMGVKPEFIYQNVPYQKGEYREGIRDALKAEKKIVEILNKTRTEPLPSDWTCVSIFCKSCGRDTTEVLKSEPPIFHYRCETCKTDSQIDFEKEGGVKLLWRVDWPMRWAKEAVDFEPGGKDHSSQGGSFETGSEIIRAVWKREPPHYVQYDFVLAKGLGAKLSSSSGQLITLSEALEIYEPAVIRWIFASRKPNIDFSIAFDLDVMKAYDDFDRSERFAYGEEEGEERKRTYEKRIYEFSTITSNEVSLQKTLPTQFPFRHLCNMLQTHEGDLEKTKQYFKTQIKTPLDESRFQSRAKRAWKWISTFAPEEFKFSLRKPETPTPKTRYPQAISEMVQLLKTGELETKSEEEIASNIYQIMKSNQLEPKTFFQEVYSILISKTSGPKLASFVLSIGPRRVAEILEKSL